MKTYTPNDILDLQLKYRNDYEVMQLIDFVADAESAVTEIAELRMSVDEKEDEIYGLQEVIGQKDDQIREQEKEINELIEKLKENKQ